MSDLVAVSNETQFLPRLEALLFAAASPVSATQLAAALHASVDEVTAGLAALRIRYGAGSGIRLQSHKGQHQLTSAAEYAADIERLLGLEGTSRLSRAALESLAIVAYQQPITRPHLDSIRGVNSDGVLKSLLTKGLVQELGRAEAPGRPILYGTTADFLQYFGLNSLQELPPLELPEGLLPEADRRDIFKD